MPLPTHSSVLPLVVKAAGLSLQYPTEPRPVLQGLELEVAAGRCVAIVGRSGSGKSSLLNLLGAMEPPQAGQLIVAGQDLVALDEEGRTRFRRRSLGFVFQSFNLIPVLDVQQNIALPLALNRLPHDERVSGLMETLGLLPLARRLPQALSGGEQQRVAIARALVHRPALVLADEPTGNLDLETSSEVIALLKGLVSCAGITLIMATHSAEAAAAADEVHQLRAGRLERIR